MSSARETGGEGREIGVERAQHVPVGLIGLRGRSGAKEAAALGGESSRRKMADSGGGLVVVGRGFCARPQVYVDRSEGRRVGGVGVGRAGGDTR